MIVMEKLIQQIRVVQPVQLIVHLTAAAMISIDAIQIRPSVPITHIIRAAATVITTVAEKTNTGANGVTAMIKITVPELMTNVPGVDVRTALPLLEQSMLQKPQ